MSKLPLEVEVCVRLRDSCFCLGVVWRTEAGPYCIKCSSREPGVIFKRSPGRDDVHAGADAETDRVVDLLNRLLEIDRVAISSLFSQRAIANDEQLEALLPAKNNFFGTLAILNAILGPNPDGTWPLGAKVLPDGTIAAFGRTGSREVKGDQGE